MAWVYKYRHIHDNTLNSSLYFVSAGGAIPTLWVYVWGNAWKGSCLHSEPGGYLSSYQHHSAWGGQSNTSNPIGRWMFSYACLFAFLLVHKTVLSCQNRFNSALKEAGECMKTPTKLDDDSDSCSANALFVISSFGRG